MGADDNWQSNLFLPLGKVRMGYPSGEARWGADVDMQSNNNTDTAKKGSAQALANPAKSITKSKNHKRNIIKK